MQCDVIREIGQIPLAKFRPIPPPSIYRPELVYVIAERSMHFLVPSSYSCKHSLSEIILRVSLSVSLVFPSQISILSTCRIPRVPYQPYRNVVRNLMQFHYVVPGPQLVEAYPFGCVLVDVWLVLLC